MESSENIERGVRLGRKMKKLVADEMEADTELTVTNVMRALSMCAADGILAVQNEALLFPGDVARPLRIFDYCVLESLQAQYPKRISPELQEHTSKLQRQLAGGPSSTH